MVTVRAAVQVRAVAGEQPQGVAEAEIVGERGTSRYTTIVRAMTGLVAADWEWELVVTVTETQATGLCVAAMAESSGGDNHP